MLVLTALIVGRFWPRARFGWADYARISEGMTECEVEVALGCPAGDYRPTPSPRNYKLLSASGAGEYRGKSRHKEWIGVEYAIQVELDENGRVAGRSLWAGHPMAGRFTDWLLSLYNRARQVIP